MRGLKERGRKREQKGRKEVARKGKEYPLQGYKKGRNKSSLFTAFI